MAGAAGIEPTGISGHSTRIGKAQDCVAAGIGIAAIMRDGGWKTEAMVVRYTEHLQLAHCPSRAGVAYPTKQKPVRSNAGEHPHFLRKLAVSIEILVDGGKVVFTFHHPTFHLHAFGGPRVG